MSRLVFILGREPELSIAEIAAVVGDAGDWSRALVSREALVVPINHPRHFDRSERSERSGEISIDRDPSPSLGMMMELMRRLGGMVKIGEELGIMNHESWSDPSAIAAWLEKQVPLSSGKTCFGFSVHDLGGGMKAVLRERKSILRIGPTVKRLLREAGRSARWVTSREATLSSVVVVKNKLLPPDGTEFLVIVAADRTIIARTLAVQPFEEWGIRDYGRPARNMERGMLPPKLARIMVNIGAASFKPQASSPIVLDPFCGTGTVLMEAMRLGYSVLGSDIDPRAITETHENLCWMQRTGVCAPQEPRLAAIAAEHVSSHVGTTRVDAIVTEPYLGPSRQPQADSRKLVGELRSMYLAAFREFAKVLKPHGRVVFIVPAFRERSGVRAVEIETEIKQLGFRIIAPFPKELANQKIIHDAQSLEYARPDQRVIRRLLIAERA